jgi:catechol-2,3-dioxygenase
MVEADEQCVTDSYKARLSLPSLTTMEGQPILLFHQAMLLMTRDHLRHLIRHLLKFVSRLAMTERHSRGIALT